MTQNREELLRWYSERGRIEDYYRIYVCRYCIWQGTCNIGKLNKEARITCKNFKAGARDAYSAVSAVWNEMSYHRIEAAGARSMQRRLRDGE